MEYLELGSAPSEEDCVQLDPKDSEYLQRMHEECLRYKQLLEKLFPCPSEKNYYGIKTFDHDFGRYKEVVIYYDQEDTSSVEFAFHIEGQCPKKWVGL